MKPDKLIPDKFKNNFTSVQYLLNLCRRNENKRDARRTTSLWVEDLLVVLKVLNPNAPKSQGRSSSA